MIDFMLNTGRQKPDGSHRLCGPIFIKIAHRHFGWPFHIGCLIGDRQTALFQNRALVRQRNDFRVHHLVQLGCLIATTINHHKALTDIDLWRGKANPRGVVHGGGHIIKQMAHPVGNLGNRLGDLPQNRVRHFHDGNQIGGAGHDT